MHYKSVSPQTLLVNHPKTKFSTDVYSINSLLKSKLFSIFKCFLNNHQTVTCFCIFSKRVRGLPGICFFLQPLLVNYLKTRFSKYPFIDEKDPELQDKIDDVLEVINVKNAPRLVIKNIFLHIQAEFSQCREGLFGKLVNNVDSVDTAAMSIDSLTEYMFEDFGLTGIIRPPQRRMILIMRSTANQTDAFVRSAKGTSRAGISGYPVSLQSYWREYKSLFESCERDFGKRDGLRKLEDIDAKRVEKYVKTESLKP